MNISFDYTIAKHCKEDGLPLHEGSVSGQGP